MFVIYRELSPAPNEGWLDTALTSVRDTLVGYMEYGAVKQF